MAPSSSLENVLWLIDGFFGGQKTRIDRVIFNDPATIVFWSNGRKTVVKCQEGDTYDREKGLLLCIAKYVFGNTGRYNDILNNLLKEDTDE